MITILLTFENIVIRYLTQKETKCQDGASKISPGIIYTRISLSDLNHNSIKTSPIMGEHDEFRINVNLFLFQSEQQMDCALDLMRRLPPQQIEKNLSDLIDLVPSLCEDLLSSVDQPLKIAKDKESGKDYLLCDYNRDGDSYR